MTARDRIVIMVVLALGAIVAGWFFVVSPKRDQASSLSTPGLERAIAAELGLRARWPPG